MTTQYLGDLGTAAGTGNVPTHIDSITKPLVISTERRMGGPGRFRVMVNSETVVSLKEVSLSGPGLGIPHSRVRKNAKTRSTAVLTCAVQD